jgi:hypothetical protein
MLCKETLQRKYLGHVMCALVVLRSCDVFASCAQIPEHNDHNHPNFLKAHGAQPGLTEES